MQKKRQHFHSRSPGRDGSHRSMFSGLSRSDTAGLNVISGGAGVIPPRSGGNVGTMSATSVEDLFQEIGREAMAAAGDDRAGKLLVYAEVERGGAGAEVAYVNRRAHGHAGVGPRLSRAPGSALVPV